MTPQDNREYLLWDPMPIFGESEDICFVLSAPRIDGTGWRNSEFWRRPNALRQYRRRMSGNWMWYGDYHPPDGWRWCAGSLGQDSGGTYLFISECELERLNQRIRICRIDGSHLEFVSEIVPSYPSFPSELRDDAGHRLFAARDCYYLRVGKVHHLYVCTGAQRWGCLPEVALLESDAISGPYRMSLRTPLIDPDLCNCSVFGEIERISILPYGDEYCMLFHCWTGQWKPSMKSALTSNGLRATSDTVWATWSGSHDGPFFLCDDQPYLLGSHDTGLYGTQFHLVGGQLRGYGWRLSECVVDDSCELVGSLSTPARCSRKFQDASPVVS